MKPKCSYDGGACLGPPTLGALRVAPEDDGSETLYEMFVSCYEHEPVLLGTAPADLEPFAFVALAVQP